MARVTHVKAARKTIPETTCGIKGGVSVGQSYYWWKFKRGGMRYSMTPPKRSQLTQSAFYSAVYSLEDDVIGNATADDGLESTRDDIVSALEEIRDQCQESLDNMPEGLQQGSTGELLQERIDAMDSAISEFEGMSFDVSDKDGDETEDDFWQGKLEELQNVSIDAP